MTDSRRIENGDHALTIVHHRWEACAGNACRTQLGAGIRRNALAVIELR